LLDKFWYLHTTSFGDNYRPRPKVLELFTDLVFLVGIGWYFLGILPTELKEQVFTFKGAHHRVMDSYFTMENCQRELPP
jgi:hypothetical protein